MSRRSKDFSKSVLTASEHFQYAVSHTAVGRGFISLFTGSKSPAYHQLDWRSGNMYSELRSTVEVPGDENAGRLARNWARALVMGVDRNIMDNLKAEGHPLKRQEAIAYVSEDVVHVGTLATGLLFEVIHDEQNRDKEYLGVAMRLGRAPLQAAMGIWLPEERAFVGSEGVEVLNPAANVPTLHYDYPGVRLG